MRVINPNKARVSPSGPTGWFMKRVLTRSAGAPVIIMIIVGLFRCRKIGLHCPKLFLISMNKLIEKPFTC